MYALIFETPAIVQKRDHLASSSRTHIDSVDRDLMCSLSGFRRQATNYLNKKKVFYMSTGLIRQVCDIGDGSFHESWSC